MKHLALVLLISLAWGQDGSLKFQTFQQSAPGTVARDVASKLAEIVSVRDFGAKGDGIADDTTKLQAAFAATCDTQVGLYFPRGTYRITGLVTCELAGVHGFRISGEGPNSTIALASDDAGFRISGTVGGAYEKVVVQDLSWKVLGCHPTALLTLYGVAVLQVSNQLMDAAGATYGLRLQGAQQGEIHGGWIRGAGTADISMDAATGSHGYIGSNMIDIHGVSLTNGPGKTQSCIELLGVGDGQIHGNHLTGCTYGIFVNNNRAYSAVIGIHDNHFEDDGAAGVYVHSERNITIANNSFYGPGTYDIHSDAVLCNMVIDGNQIDNAISLQPASDPTYGVGTVAMTNNHVLGTISISAVQARRLYSFNNNNDISGQIYPNTFSNFENNVAGILRATDGTISCAESTPLFKTPLGSCVLNINRNGLTADSVNPSVDQWQLGFNLQPNQVRLQRKNGADGSPKWIDWEVGDHGEFSTHGPIFPSAEAAGHAAGIYGGSGSPNGVVPANSGSIYLNHAVGDTSAPVWIKHGDTRSAGWFPLGGQVVTTVSGLPPCDSSTQGWDWFTVTDATVGMLGTLPHGGGSNVAKVWCNGAKWLVNGGTAPATPVSGISGSLTVYTSVTPVYKTVVVKDANGNNFNLTYVSGVRTTSQTLKFSNGVRTQ